ncbi:MAG: phosphatase PAP2 family protein [Promicromonosporaceae bacterium]|nr:phosphatase PAP2 family protein [Promicromonosporaceae bacterium]
MSVYSEVEASDELVQAPVRVIPSKIPLISGLVLIALTAIIGMVVRHSSGMLQSEYRLDQWLNEFFAPTLNGPALFLNAVFGPIGAVLLLLVISAAVWLGRHSLRLAIRFLVTGGIGWVMAAVFKIIFQEPRPALLGLCPDVFEFGAMCPWLISETGTDAFPSGHTAITTSLVLAVALVAMRHSPARIAVLWGGSLLIIAVALSRMYLGVHYLTDVIGGALIATGTVLILDWFWERKDSVAYSSPKRASTTHPKLVPVN